MKRIRCLAGICLLAALLGPWQMEAAAEEQPVSQGAAASSASGVITYEDLETLVKAYCPQVQMERIQYESRINRYEAAREEIMETRRLLREEASDMEKSGDQDGADHYYAQAKTLEEAAKEIDKQLRSARGSTSTMSYRKMEDTMLWTAQSLAGTYNSLKLEQAAAAAYSDWQQSLYEKKLALSSSGGVSPREAEEALKAAQAADNKVHKIFSEMERVKRELFMVTGYGPDAGLGIGFLPQPDEGRMALMDPKQDKQTALGNNYNLREQRSGSFTGTNKELHSRQRAIHESEESMFGQLETLYQDVTAARGIWTASHAGGSSAGAAWDAACHKMELGMLSRQEYLEARYLWLEEMAVKGKADIRFQLSMDTYDWAKKGLMGDL
ncbi:hypothetical protein [Lacrimispora sp. 210928-DFI.3.58]|uniref:hypothetical protein n=1 Tax=Lacrimispora sp. 210928-DFI.3.58 TaxID=2883214 RepID=UPI001D073EB4|nr:hypothetical protein [Lacrimispora sp. 210928-DFI.3.58]MCB7317137.1 hypothetical protein [Lacrimispora sp. 210928-DFI.3.58]